MIKIFFASAGFLAMSACSSPKTSTSQNQTAPVETMPANSPQYQPAFEGQTRIAGMTTDPATYSTKIITQALNKP